MFPRTDVRVYVPHARSPESRQNKLAMDDWVPRSVSEMTDRKRMIHFGETPRFPRMTCDMLALVAFEGADARFPIHVEDGDAPRPAIRPILFRLARDLRYLDPRRYEHAARTLDDTGRKVGAWRKVHRGREEATSP